MGGPLDLVQLHTNETTFKLHHDQIVHNKTQLHSVQGSLYPELEKLEIEAAEVFFMHFFIN